MFDFLFDLLGGVAEASSDVAEDVSDSADASDGLACNEFDGVEGGVFDGNEEELNELSEAGMVDGSEHIDSEDIVRDPAVRAEFLASCGFDSVPEGYEVHHIIPLSEGGTDDPSNMVLLTKEEHDAITAAHRNFYEWNS